MRPGTKKAVDVSVDVKLPRLVTSLVLDSIRELRRVDFIRASRKFRPRRSHVH